MLLPLAVLPILLAAACAPMPPTTSTVPSVDLERYAGTWYEVGSVKQLFSLGLVNISAEYTPQADGSVQVVNRGEYFFPGGPESRIVGSAVPVDDTGARLNVSFFGAPSADGPGNYWVVDLDPDYRWAIVSDPTGFSGFILSRTPTVSDELYQELVDRAAAAGVAVENLTRTIQG